MIQPSSAVISVALYTKDPNLLATVKPRFDEDAVYSYHYVVINNPAALQRILRRKKYRLILLDLPQLDEAVYAWLSAVLPARATAALILLGAQTDCRVEHRVLSLGVDDYWTLPLSESFQVHGRVYQALEKRKLTIRLQAESSGYASLVAALSSGKVKTVELPTGKFRVVDAKIYAEKERHIQQLRTQNQQLIDLAHKDVLTNLPNRRQFEHTMITELARAKRYKRLLVLYSIDLDEFKTINDTFGHPWGDLLLTEVAKRLQKHLWHGDFIARVGGDEFAVIVSTATHTYVVREIAEKLLATLRECYFINGKEIYVSVSVGITVFPGGGEDVEALCKSADLAMYQAKKTGGNSYCFFSGRLETEYQQYLKIKHALNVASEHQDFSLRYQPQVDIHTGAVRAIEVLLRWKHRELGEVSPVDFIPIAEETSLMTTIGEWVIQEALGQYKLWRQQLGPEIPKLAINLSPIQLRKQFPRFLQYQLARHGISTDALEFELTETAVMHYSQDSTGVLEALHRLGVSIVVDDFGTGYSSLSHLRELPISALKIDRSFVRDIPTQASAAIIVKTIIALAKSLGLELVAEGVETEAQMHFLRDNACQFAQGYHFCKPITAEKLIVFLKQLQGS